MLRVTASRIALRTSGAALAGLLMLGTACGKKDDQAATQGTAGGTIPGATPSNPAPAAVQVADVQLGKKVDANKQVADQADTFAPKDTVFASVHTTGTASNAQLVARWAFQDGQVVSERTETLSPSGDAHTEFHIAKPSGWPAGKYTLHVLLNGQEVQTKDFTVK